MTRDAEVWLTPDRDEDRFLPEGPRAVTLGGRDAVAWVNIQTAADGRTGAVFARFWDTGEVRRFDFLDRPGFFVPTDRPDTLLVGAGKTLLLFNPLTAATEVVATIPDGSPCTIINDGEVAPGGRAVVFGTKDVNFADPIAHLYWFNVRGRRLLTLAAGMTCSNGKVLTGSTLADIDTPRRRIDRYRLDHSQTGERFMVPGEPLDLSAEEGLPDGMVDAGAGTVIVAFYNPEPAAFGRAVRFDLTTGERLDEWRTPGSPRVTCPLLVRRPDGLKLILTTAVEGMPGERANAGCLFLADAGGLNPPAAEVLQLGS